MLYYIIKNSNGVHYTEPIKNATDSTYHELIRNGYNVVGVFGRSDYAKVWEDFHNGKKSREDLRNYFNKILVD